MEIFYISSKEDGVIIPNMYKQGKALIRKVIKSVFGEGLFSKYHYVLALLASNYYGNPSKKMLVVAVTGTKGKTSTINFLWHILTAGGYKVGLITSANIKIGNVEKLNWYHMTMPGRFLLQKLLRQMYDAKCDIVLVEATSEGVNQSRHIGLFYDVCVFTNLHPEHLKSHNNSFIEYRNAKGRLFSNLSKLPAKKLEKFGPVEKVIIANADNPETNYFLSFQADKKYSYGFENGEYQIRNILQNQAGVTFSIKGTDFSDETYFEIPLLGTFNILNAMPGVLLAKHLGVENKKIIEGVKNCEIIPGRMEIINEGQDFTAIVDYAHEGVSMRLALEAAKGAKKSDTNKLIAVYGGEGGGRDLTKRETMSKASADLATHAIVTLSDPFDADPKEINRDIMSWLTKFGFIEGVNAWEYVDRRDAIAKAVSLAEEGDVILFASKGAEQSIVFKEGSIPWDDRVEVRAAINKKLNK